MEAETTPRAASIAAAGSGHVGGEAGSAWLIPASLAGLVLALFSGKAFHIDDPVYLWVAQHILVEPLDFYGFSVNWYGSPGSVAAITKNPPLASYYAALVVRVFGSDGVALHLAFIVPSLLLLAGTGRLASRWGAPPALAVALLAATPVFMVSATTIMCDVPMLCLFVWAIEFWASGMDAGSNTRLLAGALLAALAALTKYFAISAIPLLLVYALLARRRPGWWLLHLAAAGLVLWGYDALTAGMYGRGLLTDAMSYAQVVGPQASGSLGPKVIATFTFAGGCLITILFFAPLLLRRAWVLAGLLFIPVVAAALAVPGLWARLAPLHPEHSLSRLLQGGLFVVSALVCLALCALDVRERRDAPTVLLFLWIAGTLAFSTFFNWTVSGRSILPMAPPLAIVVARRLAAARGLRRPLVWAALVPGAAISLLATWADYALANSVRDAAARIGREQRASSGRVWFEGHWGFQYYMEQQGFTALDLNDTSGVASGDVIVLPNNNTNVFPLRRSFARQVSMFSVAPPSLVTTQHLKAHAGFYASAFGPLPYAFGRTPPIEYFTWQVD